MEMLQAELTELFFDQMAHVKMLVAKLTYQGVLFLEQLRGAVKKKVVLFGGAHHKVATPPPPPVPSCG